MSFQKTLLKIELLPPGSMMNIKMEGEPATFCKMIANAMDTRQEIAAAFIAAVVDYAKKNGIPVSQLEYMVQIKMP